MNTDSFHAEKRSNGDVWIGPYKGYWHPFRVIIPKEHCAELAELLCPKYVLATNRTNSSVDCGGDYSIDFTRAGGEPE